MRPSSRRLASALLVGLAVCAVHAALLPTPSAAQTQEMEDVVYLKDGTVVRGMITEQRPGEYLLIQTRDRNVFRFAFDQIERITKEAVPVQFSAAPRSAAPVMVKSPGTALGLSFLFTGLGQFYNNEPAKGVLHLVVGVLAAGTMLAGVEDCYAWEEFDCSTFTIGAVGVVGTKIWTMWDAYASANRINREAATLGRLDLRVAPTAVPGPEGQRRTGLAVSLGATF